MSLNWQRVVTQKNHHLLQKQHLSIAVPLQGYHYLMVVSLGSNK